MTHGAPAWEDGVRVPTVPHASDDPEANLPQGSVIGLLDAFSRGLRWCDDGRTAEVRAVRLSAFLLALDLSPRNVTETAIRYEVSPHHIFRLLREARATLKGP